LVEIAEGFVRPQPLPQLFARDDLARTFEQSEQHLQGLFLNAYEPAIAAEFAGTASASKGPNRMTRFAPAPLSPSAIRRLYTASFLLR
jgi:hypothetical protein